MAHCRLEALGEDQYRGETDPRKLPLIIAGGSTPVLRLEHAKHVKLQDLVLRGSKTSSTPPVWLPFPAVRPVNSPAG